MAKVTFDQEEHQDKSSQWEVSTQDMERKLFKKDAKRGHPLRGKRPIDLRCQCMQQAKIDTKHMIQFNQERQDGKVQSAHSDLTWIEYSKCNERSEIRYHKFSKKCKMQSQHSEFHGQNATGS